MLVKQFSQNTLEAGTDEAGRGCLAGPVTAAAVILPPHFSHPLLNDSKKLSEKQREKLRIIIENEALSWAVAHVSPQKIDEINILNASILAMHLALSQLKVQPNFIAVDGNKFKNYSNIPHECIVKGDGKFQHIAAASILAKTHRDEAMLLMHNEFPHYGFDRHKGYPTTIHRAAITQYGSTIHHRKSFKLKETIPKTELS